MSLLVCQAPLFPRCLALIIVNGGGEVGGQGRVAADRGPGLL